MPSFKNIFSVGPAKMAHLLKALAAKNDDLRSMPRIHILEEENALSQLSSSNIPPEYQLIFKISHVLRHKTSLPEFYLTRMRQNWM